MIRHIAVVALGFAVLAGADFGAGSSAQDAKPAAPVAKKAAAGPKAGPGQKVCQYRFPDGERRSWVCDKEQPCCAWDAIKYVKCGSTFTKCL